MTRESKKVFKVRIVQRTKEGNFTAYSFTGSPRKASWMQDYPQRKRVAIHQFLKFRKINAICELG